MKWKSSLSSHCSIWVHINLWRTRSREGCDGWVSVNRDIQPEESRPCHFLRENAGIGKRRFVRTRRRRSQVIIHVHLGRRLVRPLGDAASIWSLKREQYCSAAGRHVNEGSDGIGGGTELGEQVEGHPYISMAVSRSSRKAESQTSKLEVWRTRKLGSHPPHEIVHFLFDLRKLTFNSTNLGKWSVG